MKRSLIYSILKVPQLKILVIMLLGIFWALRDIATPYGVKNILDSASNLNIEKNTELVFKSLLIIVFLWIIMEICMRIQGTLILKTVPYIRKDLCEKLLKMIKTYPYSFF